MWAFLFKMNILEKELEDVIWEAINDEKVDLSDHGLYLHSDNWIRQFNLGEYGIADIVGYTIENDAIKWEIIELKKDIIGVGTLLQALNYYKALYLISEDYETVDFRIILIGKSIDKNGSFAYIADYVEDKIELYAYNIDLINGIRFINKFGYSLLKDQSFLLAKEKFLKEIKLPTPETETDAKPNT